MNESRQESGPEEISRFRAVVIAALRVKQLRRGSKPRIEPDPQKHKDTSIAVEEVRRGLVAFTQSAVPQARDAGGMRDLTDGVEQPLTAVG